MELWALGIIAAAALGMTGACLVAPTRPVPGFPRQRGVGEIGFGLISVALGCLAMASPGVLGPDATPILAAAGGLIALPLLVLGMARLTRTDVQVRVIWLVAVVSVVVVGLDALIWETVQLRRLVIAVVLGTAGVMILLSVRRMDKRHQMAARLLGRISGVGLMLAAGSAVVAIGLGGAAPVNFGTNLTVLFAILATLAAGLSAIRHHIQDLSIHLARTARMDPVTGLESQSLFEERATTELTMSLRHDRPLSFVRLAVDRRDGATPEDQVLLDVAKRGQMLIRETDLFSRTGAASFVMMLRETPLDKATAVVERLAESLAGLPSGGTEPRDCDLTVRFGVTALGPSDLTLAEVIARADRALAKAAPTPAGIIAVETPPARSAAAVTDSAA